MYLTFFETPWGVGNVIWRDQGITGLILPGKIGQADKSVEKKVSEPFDAVRQLRYYFEKKLTRFSLPLIYRGTDFQQKVWEGLRTIPYGETWSYAELAVKIGCPGAVRPVGNANHANPIPIIIPCHRVVRGNGLPGGYGGGTELKRALIMLEQIGKTA